MRQPEAPAPTLAALWSSAVAANPPNPAYLSPLGGSWESISWERAGRAVSDLAAGFLSLEVGRGDRVAILSRTRLEWALCDWALTAIGAVTVPIQPTSSAAETSYVLADCEAQLIVCEDASQQAKIAEHREELGSLKQLIVLDGPADGAALTVADLRARGQSALRTDPTQIERAGAAIGSEDPLTLLYTSGTTGPPKGCVMTNRNYLAAVDAVLAIDGLLYPGTRVLLHLPLAHSFARLVSFLGPASQLTIALCPEPAQIPHALRELGPDILPSVPRLYERLASALEAGLASAPQPKRRISRWGVGVGYRASACREHGRSYPPRLRLEHALAERVVLAPIRKRLGGRLRVAICGAAPLAPDTARLFDALGVTLLEGYGLAESSSIATFNRPDRYRLGTVGQPLDGVELRIDPDGEILLRSATVFAGYYHDDAATREALTPEGWLRTGDLGSLDADGFLTITGRKKELIVTAGGDNISPQNLQLALEHAAGIAQALVVGDGRPFLVALVTLDQEELRRAGATPAQATALVAGAVAEVNRTRGRAEQIRRFAILPRAFSEESGELTPTLKLRRAVCAEHFRDEIERLYTSRSGTPADEDGAEED